MLQADGADGAKNSVPVGWAAAAALALLSLLVVHGPRYVARTAHLRFEQGCACGCEEQCRRWRRADLEVEGAVGADGDERGDGRSRNILCGSSVEFLVWRFSFVLLVFV